MSDPAMTHQEVRKILPQRYPFLMIDVVDKIENGPDYPRTRVGRQVVCRKNVTVNEPFFGGHFPERPIMPGVMQVECFAQAGVLVCYDSRYSPDSTNVAIAAIDKARFRKPVVPGDVFEIRVQVLKDRKTMVVVACQGYVRGQLVSECEILAAVGKWEA